jgi:COMPASS component SWD1
MSTLSFLSLEVTRTRWSRNNRYILSSSSDSTAIVWDLSLLGHPLLQPHTPITQNAASSSSTATTPRIRTIRLEAPISSAQFHPANSNIVLATLSCHEVVLIDLRKGGGVFNMEDVVDEDMEVEGEVAKKR